MKKRVGLIGAGLMGFPMAENWLKKGFSVAVLPHKNIEKVKPLEPLGAKVCRSIEDLVSESDVIILMLPTSRQVEEITLSGESCLLKLLSKNQFLVDMTTSEPSSTEMIFRRFSEKGLRFLDAPVTGGVVGAQRGTLTLFVGGSPAWMEELKDVFSGISTTQTLFGPVGSGHKAKVVNNLICIGNLAVFAEALPLSVRLGLKPDQMFQTLMTGTGASRMLELYGAQILKNDFAPRFKLAHAYKDLLIAAEIAKKDRIHFPVLNGILAHFENAIKQDLGEENISALLKPIESNLNSYFRS